MDEIIEISKKLAQEREKCLTDMFLQYGFDKEFCIEHRDDFSVIDYDNRIIYSYKGKPLFEQTQEIASEENGFRIKTVFKPLIMED